MTEIPNDVMKSVRDTLNFDRWAYQDKGDYDAAYQAVARLILAERERCKTAMLETIRLGMETISEELQDPSDETMKIVAISVFDEFKRQADDFATVGGDFDAAALNGRRFDLNTVARAAITAVRGVFFSAESPDRI